jgi:hypothetical protein
VITGRLKKVGLATRHTEVGQRCVHWFDDAPPAPSLPLRPPGVPGARGTEGAPQIITGYAPPNPNATLRGLQVIGSTIDTSTATTIAYITSSDRQTYM